MVSLFCEFCDQTVNAKQPSPMYTDKNARGLQGEPRNMEVPPQATKPQGLVEQASIDACCKTPPDAPHTRIADRSDLQYLRVFLQNSVHVQTTLELLPEDSHQEMPPRQVQCVHIGLLL